MSVADLGAALKTAITEVSVDGLTGLGMTWEPEGTVNKTPHAVKIVDGAYQAM